MEKSYKSGRQNSKEAREKWGLPGFMLSLKMMHDDESGDALEWAAKTESPTAGCAASVPGTGVAGAGRLWLLEPWVLP